MRRWLALLAVVAFCVLALPAAAAHESFTYDPPAESGTVAYDAAPVEVPFTVDPPTSCVDPPSETMIVAGDTVTVDPPERCVDPPPINGTTPYDAAPVDVPYTHDPPPRDVAIPHEDDPPPPGPVACSTANRLDWGPIYNEGDCVVGTTITVTNALWFCAQPLSQIAAQNGGTLPVRVVQTWSIATPVGTNGIEARTGCSGDGTPAIDLIVEQYLIGAGRISDPFKTRMSPGPQDVDVTGFLNASGPDATPGAGDHQDCIQFQGGRENDFVNIDGCGDYDAGVSNTQAAGGTLFFSLNNSHARILGGEFIGCNHGLTAAPDQVAPGSLVDGAKFRTVGPNKPDSPWCASFFGPAPPCDVDDADLQLVNVTCQRYLNGQWADVAPTG
jgi:hypothetical protein